MPAKSSDMRSVESESANGAELKVLRAIWFHNAATRAAIADVTGLSRPTIIAAIQSLRQKDLIRGERQRQGALGRDPEVISVNSEAQLGYGVDIGGSKISAALVDLKGEILSELTLPTPKGDPRALAAGVAQMQDQLLRRIGRKTGKVTFAAIGMPGVLQDDGRVVNSGTLEGLDQVDVPSLFEDALGCAIHIENDVNMAAYGELLGSESFSRGTRVLISVGTGLGMGIVHRGEVLRGSSGHAGEISYLPLATHLDHAELRRHGAAELLASGPVFERRYYELAGKKLSASQILSAFLEDDPHALVAVAELAHHLSRVVVSVVVTLDPEIVVMAGGLGSSPILMDPLMQEVQKLSPLPVKLELAQFGARAGLVGASTFVQRSLEKRVTQQVRGA